jgi:hypothetical protein
VDLVVVALPYDHDLREYVYLGVDEQRTAKAMVNARPAPPSHPGAAGARGSPDGASTASPRPKQNCAA